MSRIRTNLRGWSTNRKIVVIESDDWGSIRMPSRNTYEKCLQAGYPVDQEPFERYDSLESEEDLCSLFDLLMSFIDSNGNKPGITANCVVANPDFDKIKEDGFQTYHYELVSETFKKYPKHSKSFDLWEEGMTLGIFNPQYHCREHLNVSLFMRDLGRGVEEAHFGFKNNMPGCLPKGANSTGNSYVEATSYSSEADKREKLNFYLEGLDIFEDIFGKQSKSIIPPNYKWSPDFNTALRAKGVRFIQGLHTMFEPIPGKQNNHYYHFLGKMSEGGLISLVRNAIFEPSQTIKGVSDPVDYCLYDIALAFRMKKPALISSHRLNYIGYIDENNRKKNLRQLKTLLSEVIKRWPDVEFLTSDQLGETIAAGYELCTETSANKS